MKTAYIIGAGFSGLTAGRLLAENRYKVTIIEKRDRIGGNACDDYEDGVLVHRYGPHLFHTKIKEVSEFVQRFSEFVPYEHRVLGELEGKLAPIPFNFKSMEILFPAGKCEKLKQDLIKAYGENRSVPILELRKNPNVGIRELAEYVFRNVFIGYTRKQWGVPPDKMDASVMGRVPVRISEDDRYFDDAFQKMPRYGYTSLFKEMASHENITLRLSEDAAGHLAFRNGACYYDETRPDVLIYTGSLDELLQYRYGRLPCRSLRFRFERFEQLDYFQPVVQVNYPNRHAYTRICEFKRLQESAPARKTVISYEYPIECKEGDIPYYPIENSQNRQLYEKYKQDLTKAENLYLLGRLAEYQYYNMDLAIHQAMKLAERLCGDVSPAAGRRNGE